MSSEPDIKAKAIQLRIESLKANRNFFTVLFTIESAILGIFLTFLAHLSIASAVSVTLIFSSITLVLLGIFSLTDSLHFYSKYIEYQFAWDDQVHGKAYPKSDKTKKATADGRRALEADDVGYYFLKLSLLAFFYFLTFLALSIPGIGVGVRIPMTLLFTFLVTYVMIYAYKTTHRKTFWEAFNDFFMRTPVFSRTEETTQTKEETK
jgi:uncharacterized membrane protein